MPELGGASMIEHLTDVDRVVIAIAIIWMPVAYALHIRHEIEAASLDELHKGEEHDAVQ